LLPRRARSLAQRPQIGKGLVRDPAQLLALLERKREWTSCSSCGLRAGPPGSMAARYAAAVNGIWRLRKEMCPGRAEHSGANRGSGITVAL
jgi:hypothetical protein